MLDTKIKTELIDERLAHAAELWAADSYSGVQSQTLDLSFFKVSLIPQPLQTLAPDTHELKLNGRALHVLLGEANGERYAVVDDQSDFESIESSSYITLGIAFLGGSGLCSAEVHIACMGMGSDHASIQEGLKISFSGIQR